MNGISTRIFAGFLALLVPVVTWAAEPQPFSDIYPGHPYYEATLYLEQRGIVEGFLDGTFRPGTPVNRAEAIKMIIAPVVAWDALQSTTSVYADVPAHAWFTPYVEAARMLGVIDPPPAKTRFLPGDAVNRAEFLKMLQLGFGSDPHTLSEIRLPLASDVRDPEAWHYPYIRTGIASSLLAGRLDDRLGPGEALTRGDTAVLLYRYLRYQTGERTQALLNETEDQIFQIIGALDNRDIDRAEHASARALVAARGAFSAAPDEPLTEGTVKIAEAYRSLVLAYRAGSNGDEVQTYTRSAWNLASDAERISPALARVAAQVRDISEAMADLAASQS